MMIGMWLSFFIGTTIMCIGRLISLRWKISELEHEIYNLRERTAIHLNSLASKNYELATLKQELNKLKNKPNKWQSMTELIKPEELDKKKAQEIVEEPEELNQVIKAARKPDSNDKLPRNTLWVHLEEIKLVYNPTEMPKVVSYHMQISKDINKPNWIVCK